MIKLPFLSVAFLSLSKECVSSSFTLVTSNGNSGQIGWVPSTMLPYQMNEEASNEIHIDESGHLTGSVTNITRKMDGILSYEELFVSLVCDEGKGERVVASSDPFPIDLETRLVEMDQSNFVNPAALSNCINPTVLVRRNGCVKSQGCKWNDKSNTRWLAKSAPKTICSSEETGYGKTYLYSSGIMSCPGTKGKYKIGGVSGCWNPYIMDDGGHVEIDMDGNFYATFSGIARESDKKMLYEEIYASIVCAFKIVNKTDPVAVPNTTATVTITAQSFFFGQDCVAPIVLFHRNGCTKASGCPSNDKSNKKWLALSGFPASISDAIAV